MSCGSCGGGSGSIRIERIGIHNTPIKIARNPIRLGSRKLIAKPFAPTIPANSLDKHRA